MRTAALGLVAALAGCNQIWGNDPVSRWDAPVGGGSPEAPLPTVRLELLVTTTDATGAATNSPELRPIEPPPTVQIGRFDGALMHATYTAGTIEIPHDYPGTPWRLVFTRAGDIPREVHWAPAAGEGRAVVPQFGGIDREPVPAGASYRLQPSGAPAQYSNLRVYTTGMWAAGTPTAAGSVATQQVNEAALPPVAGPLLAPDPSKGDLVALVNYTGTFPCVRAHGAAVFRIPLTGPDSQPASAPAYVTAGSGVTVGGVGVAIAARVADRYDALPHGVNVHAMYGIGASTVAPAFVTKPFTSPLAGPAMIPLISCLSFMSNLNTELHVGLPFAVPVLDTTLPRVAHVQLAIERGFPNYPRAFEGLSASVATTNVGTFAFAFDWLVGIPINIKLGDTALTGASNRIPLTGSSPTVDLTFDLDENGGAPGLADYATVTLYRVDSSALALIPERHFTFVGTRLTIDRAVLAPQTEYVIELRTHTGAPRAAAGDFTQYLETQFAATRLTRSFVTP